MNILSNLIEKLATGDANKPLTAEEEEALEKQGRIKFHRESVRNGPIKLKSMTSGQVRRSQSRATKSMMKKARRKQIRDYFDQQREGATLRAHLHAVGLISFTGLPHNLPPRAVEMGATWLVAHFADEVPEEATREEWDAIVRSSFQSALNRWQTIVGMPVSALPEGYEIPISA